MTEQKTIQDLEEIILQAQAKIKELKKPKNIRPKARWGEFVYSVSASGNIFGTNSKYEEEESYKIGNYFLTKQEAIDYRDNLITKQELKDLALRLNNGVELDWSKESHRKYYIFINYIGLNYSWCDVSFGLGQVYCLDENFLEIAKKEIGEDRLIKLIKSGV